MGKAFFVECMPKNFKAVFTAAVISEVLKNFPDRAKSIAYKNGNPQEMRKHVGESMTFSKKKRTL